MTFLLPGVCHHLAKLDTIHSDRLLQMFTLFQKGLFPTENICYRIFLDLIQWYSLDSSKAMKYDSNVRKFWYLGKRLFHNKFVEYMRGPGNKGQDDSDFEERSTHINFPVPHRLSDANSKVPSHIEPGFIHAIVEHYQNSHPNSLVKPHNLSGDLKKINQSPSSPMGGIDLSGFEKQPTKGDLDKRLSDELEEINKTISLVDDLHNCHIPTSLSPGKLEIVVPQIQNVILIMTDDQDVELG